MGAPPAETVIINRCLREESYEYQARVGKLPGRVGILPHGHAVDSVELGKPA